MCTRPLSICETYWHRMINVYVNPMSILASRWGQPVNDVVTCETFFQIAEVNLHSFVLDIGILFSFHYSREADDHHL